MPLTAPRPESWLRVTPAGLYCQPGDFHIDPVRPVARAVITHGHGDHARPSNEAVLATSETIAIMRARYGELAGGALQPAGYGERVALGDVAVTLVPAGHVLGSAQAVIDHRGSRVVVSGDYKRRPDPTCLPFEPRHCDLFITEATFGLPVFRHPPDRHEIDRLLHSLRLYPDPQSTALRAALATYHQVRPEQVFVGNGSDEVLAHAFAALLSMTRRCSSRTSRTVSTRSIAAWSASPMRQCRSMRRCKSELPTIAGRPARSSCPIRTRRPGLRCHGPRSRPCWSNILTLPW